MPSQTIAKSHRTRISLVLAAACLLSAGHPLEAAGRKKSPKMTTPAHQSAPVIWGHAANGLRLGLGRQGTTVRFCLQNVGAHPLTVLSHVEAGEKQYEWYTVHLKDAHGHARTLHFVADRDESWRVTSPLDSGAHLDNDVDLAAWAQQPINGEQLLAPGTYEVSAVYDVPAENADGCWTGRLEAGPIKLTAPER